jgi:hypothetical protein
MSAGAYWLTSPEQDGRYLLFEEGESVAVSVEVRGGFVRLRGFLKSVAMVSGTWRYVGPIGEGE